MLVIARALAPVAIPELPNPYKFIRSHRLPLRGTVEACLHPTAVYRRISVGRGHVLLNQRLCHRVRSTLANRLDSATPFCSLLPPQAALANVPPPVQELTIG